MPFHKPTIQNTHTEEGTTKTINAEDLYETLTGEKPPRKKPRKKRVTKNDTDPSDV